MMSAGGPPTNASNVELSDPGGAPVSAPRPGIPECILRARSFQDRIRGAPSLPQLGRRRCTPVQYVTNPWVLGGPTPEPEIAGNS